MAEALEKVKRDLGRAAVILHTRTVRRGGLMGVGARSVVEITASRDPSLLPRPDRPAGPARREAVHNTTPSRSRQAETLAMQPPAQTSVPRKTSGTDALTQISSSTSALRNEMEELRTMVRQLLEREQLPPPAATSVAPGAGAGRIAPPIPEELRDYYTSLIQNAVADELARDVVARAKERLNEWQQRLRAAGPAKIEPLDFQKLIPDALLEVIERMLPTADPVQLVSGAGPKFVALVGPTGVGKTTTIAKLAAQFKLRDHKRVAMITTDTYRIAAVAQLKAYADILSVPLEVVYTPDELADTMRKMNGYDVVLIDTSGRSQNDAEHLGDLQAFLNKAREVSRGISGRDTETEKTETGKTETEKTEPANEPAGGGSSLETHLVLSCTAHANQLQQVLDKFSGVGIDRIAFTKLDEAVGVGVILNIAHRLDVQLSYLTTGQDVPDDIEIGNRRRIAELVLNLPAGGTCASADGSVPSKPAEVPAEAAGKTKTPEAGTPKRPAGLINHLA